MSILFRSKPVLDRVREARNLSRLRLPAPPNFESANQIFVPSGPSPARGFLLMKRGDLDAIGVNSLHHLEFTDEFGTNLKLFNLVIADEPVAVTGGVVNDKDAAYLVEVSDARHLCHNPRYSVSANKQYNVRAPAYSAASSPTCYYASSLNAGAAWTWATMAEDLWNLMSSKLGTWPGLPSGLSPNGVPEGFSFVGVSAWLALCQVLTRINCAVKPELADNRFVVVRVSDADTAAAAAIARADGQNRRLHDIQAQSAKRGKVPYGVRVFFHKRWQHAGSEEATPRTSSQWQTDSAYTVDVDGPHIADAEAGTYHPLWDDMPALYNAAGTLQNTTDLANRATERADDYFDSLTGNGGGLYDAVFSGIVPAHPGSTYRGVAWGQGVNGGLYTRLVRGPGFLMVGDGGRFVPNGFGDSSMTRPPNFQPSWPNYPPLSQSVRVTSATADGSGRYSAKLNKYNAGTLASSDGDDCYLIPLGGGALTTGIYLARLHGYSNSLPLYVTGKVEQTTIGITVEDDDSNPTYPGITTLRFDQSDGFVLSNPSAGVALVDFTASAATFSGARAYDDSGTQAITTVTATAILFNKERYDTASYHSTASNTSRLTIPSAGYYHVGGNVSWVTTPPYTGLFQLYILLNATTIIAFTSEERAASSQNINQNISTDYYFSANDYVELYVYYTTVAGGISVAANHSPEFWIHFIGP